MEKERFMKTRKNKVIAPLVLSKRNSNMILSGKAKTVMLILICELMKQKRNSQNTCLNLSKFGETLQKIQVLN